MLLNKKRKKIYLLTTAAVLACMLTACGFGGGKGSVASGEEQVTQQTASEENTEGSQASVSTLPENSVLNYCDDAGFARLQSDMASGNYPVECSAYYENGSAAPVITVTDQDQIRDLYGMLADVTVDGKSSETNKKSNNYISFRLRNDTRVSFYFEGEDLFCWENDNYAVSGSSNLWYHVRQMQGSTVKEEKGAAKQASASYTGTTTDAKTDAADKSNTKDESSSNGKTDEEKSAGEGRSREEIDISGVVREQESNTDKKAVTGTSESVPDSSDSSISSARTEESGSASEKDKEKKSAAEDSAVTGAGTGTEDTETEEKKETKSAAAEAAVAPETEKEADKEAGKDAEKDAAETGETETAETGKTQAAETGETEAAETGETAAETAETGQTETAETGETAAEAADPSLTAARDAAYTEIVHAYAAVLSGDREAFLEAYDQGLYSAGTDAAAVSADETAAESMEETADDSAAESMEETADDSAAEGMEDAAGESAAEVTDEAAAGSTGTTPVVDARLNYELFRDYFMDPDRTTVSYGLYDYNEDGTPELAILLTDGEFKLIRAMYTFDGTKAVPLFTGNLSLAYRTDLFLLPDNTFIVHGSGGATAGADTICRIAEKATGLEVIAVYEYDEAANGSLDHFSTTAETLTDEEFNEKYGNTSNPADKLTPAAVSADVQIITAPAAEETAE